MIDEQDYEKEYSNFLKEMKVAHQEWNKDYFEAIWLNEPRYTTFQYEEAKSETKQQMSFMLSQEQCNDLVGEKNEWDQAMARTFYKNAIQLWDDGDLEDGRKHFNGYEKTWLRK